MEQIQTIWWRKELQALSAQTLLLQAQLQAIHKRGWKNLLQIGRRENANIRIVNCRDEKSSNGPVIRSICLSSFINDTFPSSVLPFYCPTISALMFQMQMENATLQLTFQIEAFIILTMSLLKFVLLAMMLGMAMSCLQLLSCLSPCGGKSNRLSTVHKAIAPKGCCVGGCCREDDSSSESRRPSPPPLQKCPVHLQPQPRPTPPPSCQPPQPTPLPYPQPIITPYPQPIQVPQPYLPGCQLPQPGPIPLPYGHQPFGQPINPPIITPPCSGWPQYPTNIPSPIVCAPGQCHTC